MTRLRSAAPSLRVERLHLRNGCELVAGMDEVGRGALAGPVSVGVVVVRADTRSAPVGLRDSKLLSAQAREALVPPLRRWGLAWGVGHAEPEEIDAYGIMTGLRLAGRRALHRAGVRPDLVVLDGNHDWLTDPARVGLFADLPCDPAPDEPAGEAGGLPPGRRPPPDLEPVPPVITVIKGDRTCSSVAAASVLAKVERDTLMVRRHESHPDYGWAINKGYAAPLHRDALLRLGPCGQHRRSWNLGVGPGAERGETPGGTLGVESPGGTAGVERRARRTERVLDIEAASAAYGADGR